MDFKLLVYLKESDSGTTHELDNSYIVGRDSSCGIRIVGNLLTKGHCTLSREHCTLIYMPKTKVDPNRYYLLKDGVFAGDRSTNGTWLNKTRIKELIRLKHQDVITFGGNYPQAIFWESESENELCKNATFPFDYNEEKL